MVITNIYIEINLKSTLEINLMFHGDFIINEINTLWLGVCGKNTTI